MAKRARHFPTRTCVGCGERAQQRDLVRLRATADGRLSEVEPFGRSAYLHASAACVKDLARSKVLARALRRNIPAEVRGEAIEALMRRLAADATAQSERRASV